MQRLSLSPRPEWQQRVEALDMRYAVIDGRLYWNESAYYCLTRSDISILEQSSRELHAMYMATAQYAFDNELLGKLGIQEQMAEAAWVSWERDDPYLYGRFDLAYNGIDPPKLLEYNAQTPTALFEAAIVQRAWQQECFPDRGQWNRVDDALTERWKWMRKVMEWPEGMLMHFAGIAESIEDRGNIAYLQRTAECAGFTTTFLPSKQIGWHHFRKQFMDDDNREIKAIFNLLPYEWDGEEVQRQLQISNTIFLEPPWKMVLHSKGMLALLWELFPGHPNLLPTSFERPLTAEWVSKPLFSREGANIRIHSNAGETVTPGEYDKYPVIYQGFSPLPTMNGMHPVIGSWMIGSEACGFGIREDATLVTGNFSHFVPHVLA